MFHLSSENSYETVSKVYQFLTSSALVNPLRPNDHYSGRTVPLTSKRCILYIYSTNIGIAYFKHGIYSLFLRFKMQFIS